MRSKKPFKIVKTQYLITSIMTLVGNVGGTLGLFIGFSFLNISEWMIDFVTARIKKGLVKKRHFRARVNNFDGKRAPDCS